jgi:hypothetical protein
LSARELLLSKITRTLRGQPKQDEL